MPMEQVVHILQEEADKGWRDPELTAVFIDIIRQRPESLELPHGVGDDLGRDLFADIARTGF